MAALATVEAPLRHGRHASRRRADPPAAPAPHLSEQAALASAVRQGFSQQASTAKIRPGEAHAGRAALCAAARLVLAVGNHAARRGAPVLLGLAMRRTRRADDHAINCATALSRAGEHAEGAGAVEQVAGAPNGRRRQSRRAASPARLLRRSLAEQPRRSRLEFTSAPPAQPVTGAAPAGAWAGQCWKTCLMAASTISVWWPISRRCSRLRQILLSRRRWRVGGQAYWRARHAVDARRAAAIAGGNQPCPPSWTSAGLALVGDTFLQVVGEVHATCSWSR